MDWDKKAQENLLPLSSKETNLELALQEWFYTGIGFDHVTPSETCQLCENIGLRYHFEIKNKHTKNILLVGSSCILRFDIAVYDEDGELLRGKDKEKKLNAKIREFKTQSALEALRQLWKIDKKNRELIEVYVRSFKGNKGFSPDQLLFLFNRLQANNIEYEPTCYKVTLRSKRDRDELLRMSDDDVKLIWKSLSASQKRNYPIWQKKKQEETDRLERERKKREKAYQRQQEWRQRTTIGKNDLEVVTPDTSIQTRKSYSKKKVVCEICGQVTDDWWYHNGATNTCICNDCKKLGQQ